MRLLQLDETRNCAEIVTEMQIAGRLHAGKSALGKVRRGRRHRDSSDAPPYVSRQAAAQASRTFAARGWYATMHRLICGRVQGDRDAGCTPS
jgi:hypothetical protein